MNIIIFVLTLVVKFQNSIAHIWGEDVTDQKCIDDAKCDETGHGHNFLRLELLSRHNEYRIALANGTQKNGNCGDMTFPMASNMSLLTYDCELEKIAFNISKMCLNVTDPNFNHVGSNIATFHPGDPRYSRRSRDRTAYSIGLGMEDVFTFMDSWWSTSINDAPLVNLTPTCNDSRKIPFLQMANAATTKFGCSFSICNESIPPFVSFVCQYGEPHINVGVPIYEEGPPCSDCNMSCVFGSLCNNDDVLIYNNSMRPCSDCNRSCVNESQCQGGLITMCNVENYHYDSDEGGDDNVGGDDDDNDDSDGRC
ncbi:hypothetical protein KIN20_028589 [Parelaphostrongylus tenuis]|uniref:SCP domain-containing protein n=1 Tax=Parelaphostrongylus tenuis TaxID=148309 RepID=A0AAD5R1H2_PARTN|nr:hypothetical protein KIN20_028589 [Parelaphostrongylus tenuis]